MPICTFSARRVLRELPDGGHRVTLTQQDTTNKRSCKAQLPFQLAGLTLLPSFLLEFDS